MGRHRSLIVSLAASALVACGSDPHEVSVQTGGSADTASSDPDIGDPDIGRFFFDHALPETNGRSCATCHVAEQHFVLLPATVEARLEHDPHDALFNPIDSDDPTAASPTYDHMRKQGLIRVQIKLPENMDVIDPAGNVITNASRTVALWRGVPTIENTDLTAPYQYDGRAATLQAQALSALQTHSEIPYDPPDALLDLIAGFEKTEFSSRRVAAVANAIDHGFPPPDSDPPFAPGSPEAEGKTLFQTACAPCHGGPRGDQFTNQAVHDAFFPRLDANGSPVLDPVTGLPVLQTGYENDTFINLGIAAFTYFEEHGDIPNPSGLAFPHYRFRFYSDGTRTEAQVDLPPPPPALGRNFFPQDYTVDPGRALISGDPEDFEAFRMPQLRGIANTAPYFHDNSVPDLAALLDFYSENILPVIPALNLPPVFPPITPGGAGESLSEAQKSQLLAYLKKI